MEDSRARRPRLLEEGIGAFWVNPTDWGAVLTILAGLPGGALCASFFSLSGVTGGLYLTVTTIAFDVNPYLTWLPSGKL
jgi:hypothetical protein